MKRLFFPSYVFSTISASLTVLHVCIPPKLYSYITYLCVVASASATISSAAQLEQIQAAEAGRSTAASALPTSKNPAHKARPLLMRRSEVPIGARLNVSSAERPAASTPTSTTGAPLQHDASSIRDNSAVGRPLQSTTVPMTGPDSVSDTQLARISIPSNVPARPERPQVQQRRPLASLSQPLEDRDSGEDFQGPRRSSRPRKRAANDSNFDFSFNMTTTDEDEPQPAAVHPERPATRPAEEMPRKGRKFSKSGKGKQLQRSINLVAPSTSRHVSSEDDDFEEVFTSQVTTRRSRGRYSRLSAEECDDIAQRLMHKIKKQARGSFINCNIKELHFH